MRKFFALFAFVILGAVLVLRSVGIDQVTGFFSPETPEPPPLERTWLLEEFDDNQNNWDLREEATRRNALVSGRYVLNNRTTDEYQWTRIPVDSLSDFQDFTIEAEVVKVSGRDNNTYGIIWGFDEEFRRYEFGLTGSRSYRIARIINNDWEYLVEYTDSEVIRGEGEPNTLTVRKRGFEMIFLINQQPVDTLSYQPLFGSGVGFGLHSDMSIEIESLRISSP